MEPTAMTTVFTLLTSGGYGVAAIFSGVIVYLWVQMQSDRKQSRAELQALNVQSKADLQALNDRICTVLSQTLPALQQTTAALAELKAAVVELRISLRRD